MKFKLIFLALLFCPLAFGQGVKQQWATTNTPSMVSNITAFIGRTNRTGNTVASNLWDRGNIKFWGAVSGSSDSSAAVQAAINNTTNFEGGPVLIPPGNYTWSNTIVLRHGVTLGSQLVGYLNSTTGSVVITSYANPAITNEAPMDEGYSPGLDLNGITLVGQGTGVGVDLGSPRGKITDMWIRNFGIGMRVSSAIDLSLENNLITTCTNAAFVVRSNGVTSTTISLTKCYFRESLWSAIIESGASLDVTFDKCIFESCTNGAVDLQKGSVGSFFDCYSENIPVNDVTNAILWVGVHGATSAAANDSTAAYIYGGRWAGRNAAVPNGSRWIYADDVYNLHVSGADVRRVDKVITTTANTKRVELFGVSPITVGTSPYDINDWTVILGTLPVNRSGGVDLPILSTSQVLFQTGLTNFWSVRAEFNATNPDLIWKANNVERWRVNNVGKFGIGVASPAASMDIFTSTSTFPSGISDDLKLTSAEGTGLWMHSTDSNKGIMFYETSGALRIYTESASALVAPALTVAASGSVGIGPTAPAAVLDVTGDIRALTTITATNSFMLPTNYVAANFVPVAGMVKICASNGVLWKVTQLTTNLLSANTP